MAGAPKNSSVDHEKDNDEEYRIPNQNPGRGDHENQKTDVTQETEFKENETNQISIELLQELPGKHNSCLFNPKCCKIIWIVIGFLFVCGVVGIIIYAIIGTTTEKGRNNLPKKIPKLVKSQPIDHGPFCFCKNVDGCDENDSIKCPAGEECYSITHVEKFHSEEFQEVWKCKENPNELNCHKNEKLQTFECWSKDDYGNKRPCSCFDGDEKRIID